MELNNLNKIRSYTVICKINAVFHVNNLKSKRWFQFINISLPTYILNLESTGACYGFPSLNRNLTLLAGTAILLLVSLKNANISKFLPRLSKPFTNS